MTFSLLSFFHLSTSIFFFDSHSVSHLLLSLNANLIFGRGRIRILSFDRKRQVESRLTPTEEKNPYLLFTLSLTLSFGVQFFSFSEQRAKLKPLAANSSRPADEEVRSEA